MIRETITIKKTLWLALRKQLTGEYGNIDLDCEIILLKEPRIHITACADGDNVNVTITYNPLEIVLDIRRAQQKRRRRKMPRREMALDVPLA